MKYNMVNCLHLEKVISQTNLRSLAETGQFFYLFVFGILKTLSFQISYGICIPEKAHQPE